MALIPLIPLARTVGLVDRPGGRKHHIGDVPLIGGIAMFTGTLLTMWLFMRELEHHQWSMLAGGAMLIMVGVADDYRHRPVWLRFGIQGAAALTMIIRTGPTQLSLRGPV